MIETLRWLGVLLITAVRERRDLAFENLALRQQLRVLKRRNGVPRLKRKDRLFWVVFSRIWAPWRRALQLVKALRRSWVGNERGSESIGPGFRSGKVEVGSKRVRTSER